MLKPLMEKHKKLLRYLFFGVCTTGINAVCYGALYKRAELSNVISTIFAWFAAVVFAFITNKRYVFESKYTEAVETLKEFVSFFSCRAMTGILDVVIMFATVDCLQWNSLLWKLLSNVIVTIINYFVSKYYVFSEIND